MKRKRAMGKGWTRECWAIVQPLGVECIRCYPDTAEDALEECRQSYPEDGPWRIVRGTFVPAPRKARRR